MKSSSFSRTSLALVLVILTAAACAAQKGSSTAIDRISVGDARKMVTTGDALLVCSYEDGRCKTMLLEGAILKSQFESRLPSLPKAQPIIFYCA
jgi:hypothetical protein